MDEFDQGIRNILNYGHTFGHAIETTTGYLVPHGQAVSIGIIVANEISVSMGLISKEYADYVMVNILKIISPEFKKGDLYDPVRIVRTMKMDKKYSGAHNCILLTKDGAKMFKGLHEELIIKGLNILKNIKW